MELGLELISFDRHFQRVPGPVWVHPGEEPEVVVGTMTRRVYADLRSLATVSFSR
jgi:hypothetical protein